MILSCNIKGRVPTGNLPFILFSQLAEPLFEVTHPLLAVDEILIGAPAVTACGINVHGGAYAVGLKGVVVLYAVTYGHQVVIGVGHDECWRGVTGNLLLVRV